jgi:hypothetical protein
VADPQFGFGLDSEAIHHCVAFVECNEAVLLLHLAMDHHVALEALAAEPLTINSTSIMMHMQLHGNVFEIRPDEEDETPE